MVAPKPGDTVLDACAAPGGKATHLAELMLNQGTVIALENDPGRMGKVLENSERLGTTIIVPTLGDAAKYQREGFDKILIDAPCSGLGVLRRHPDGRWNKSERTIRERTIDQRRILENCANLLKPGGALVYATCTTEPEENEEIIAAFLSGPGNGFAIDDPRPYLPARARALVDEKGFFHSFPQATEMDGFFGARLVGKK
jgi:16S rRNA (cytosine967-C5)-methyltransferase